MERMTATPIARLLIVDDAATLTKALGELLRHEGYETVAVTTAAAAIQELERSQFDILLTDLEMPGMNGVELLSAALAFDPQLVGILMTGQGSIETAVQAMKAGAHDYVLKPMKLASLLPVLARAMNLRQLSLENLELRNTVAIHELSEAIALTRDSASLLDKIADVVIAQFAADEVSILLMDEDGATFVVAAERGAGWNAKLGTRVTLSEAIAARMAATGEPIILGSESDAARLMLPHLGSGVQSAMSIPMVTRGKLIGILNIAYTGRSRTFPPGQVRIITIFANGAAAVIEASRLYERARRSEARYREMLHMAADGIISVDQDQRIVVFNLGAERLFGYRAAEVIGERLDLLLPAGLAAAHASHVSEFGKNAAQSLPMEARRSQLLGRRKDGTLVEIEAGISKHFEGDQALFTAVVHDCTERRRAEKEILDLNASLEKRVAERTRQLEAANRAKSDFLSSMSHELRTPLNSIIGFSELLENGVVGPLTEKQKEFAGDILGAGTHLLSLINDILDLSKVEAGMAKLELKPVDIASLLRASTVVVRERAVTHRIRLDSEIAPALGSVLADARKLKQIVYNLLSNAIKFTPDGGSVTLRAKTCTRAEVALSGVMPSRLLGALEGDDAEFLVIAVDDTGIGIAEADLPMLFEPFTQVDNSGTRSQAGTGLGLSLVRRLAELHGGAVGVESRVNAGSHFYVWLPYRPVRHAEPECPAVSRPASVPAGVPAGARPLALVIDDDDLSADEIAAQLRGEGFEVMRAATAEDGLVRAAKRPPQLITLDIFLPSMDGWEFMRRLKADPKLATTPVVIITAAEEVGAGLALGARRVLSKPLVREDLIATLRGMVRARTDGGPARILVVDDDAKAVALVATILESERYEVLRAYGGAEAVAMAEREQPDLVITDLMMPNMSGFEVVRALRTSERTARIPIIVLTAKDLTAEDRERLSGDVTAVLAKASFGRRDLLATLHGALPEPDDG